MSKLPPYIQPSLSPLLWANQYDTIAMMVYTLHLSGAAVDEIPKPTASSPLVKAERSTPVSFSASRQLRACVARGAGEGGYRHRERSVVSER